MNIKNEKPAKDGLFKTLSKLDKKFHEDMHRIVGKIVNKIVTETKKLIEIAKKRWLLVCHMTLASLCLLAILYLPNQKEPYKVLSQNLIQTPTGFCPPVTDREFWKKMEGKIQAYNPPNTAPQTLSSKDLYQYLFYGTQTECLLDQGTWTRFLESSITKILKIPWGDTQIPLDELNRTPIVDLSSTALAANLASTVRLLNERLNPKLTEDIKKALNERIIKPYLSASDRFQRQGNYGRYTTPAFWVGTEDNWSAVCLANIAYTSLAINDRKTNLIVLEKINRDIQPYFNSFENDGFFGGGIRYWDYGFGHFVLLADIMYKATNGHINYYKIPKVKMALQFPIKSLIGQQDNKNSTITKHFHFGDNHGYSELNPWMWNILQKRYKIPQKFPEKNLKADLWPPSLPILELCLNPPKTPSITIDAEKNTFFPESGVLVTRSQTGITLAIKGNHNAEENAHNHNDVGSYIIYDDRQYLTGEPGGGYYEGAFGIDRFQRPIESSWGHPVPVVDNQLQRTGKDAAAKVLKYEETSKKTEIQYDLSQAYQVSNLKLLTRTVTLEKETGEIRIRDEFEAFKPIPFESVIIQGVKLQKSKPPHIRVDTSNVYKVKETYFDGNDMFAGVRRIAIELEKNNTGWIEYAITPRTNNETNP